MSVFIPKQLILLRRTSIIQVLVLVSSSSTYLFLPCPEPNLDTKRTLKKHLMNTTLLPQVTPNTIWCDLVSTVSK